MNCDEPHLMANEKMQPKKWTVMNPIWRQMKKCSPSSGQMAAGSLWPNIFICWQGQSVCDAFILLFYYFLFCGIKSSLVRIKGVQILWTGFDTQFHSRWPIPNPISSYTLKLGVEKKQGIIVYRVIERPREALKDKLIVIIIYNCLGLKLVYV